MCCLGWPEESRVAAQLKAHRIGLKGEMRCSLLVMPLGGQWSTADKRDSTNQPSLTQPSVHGRDLESSLSRAIKSFCMREADEPGFTSLNQHFGKTRLPFERCPEHSHPWPLSSKCLQALTTRTQRSLTFCSVFPSPNPGPGPSPAALLSLPPSSPLLCIGVAVVMIQGYGLIKAYSEVYCILLE